MVTTFAFFRNSGVESGQVRRAWVRDLGVGDDVDEGRLPRGEGPLERRSDLVGSGHVLAPAPERLHDPVVTKLRPEVGRDVVAVEGSHRMLLEAPYAVVAHDRHHR